MEKKTLEEVIQEANIIHNNKFNYSEANYINAHTKTTVLCPEHGEWEVSWSNHINHRTGCPDCSRDAGRSTLEEVIQQANYIHDNKYDYSKAKYINNRSKTILICPEHGEWKVSWDNHLNKKSRCPLCALEINASKRTRTLEEAILRANHIHNNKYNYSKANYTKVMEKTTIICPEHGEWTSSWNNHLSKKSGCPTCAEINKNNRYLDQPTTFYYLKYKGLYKIGITIKSIKGRYINKELNKEEWKDVEILYSKEFNTGGQAFVLEQNLISKYKDSRYKGAPIFRKTGNSEVFKEDILGVEEYNENRQRYFQDSLKLAEMSKEEYKIIKEGNINENKF